MYYVKRCIVYKSVFKLCMIDLSFGARRSIVLDQSGAFITFDWPMSIEYRVDALDRISKRIRPLDGISAKQNIILNIFFALHAFPHMLSHSLTLCMILKNHYLTFQDTLTLRLSWKKGVLIKKSVYSQNIVCCIGCSDISRMHCGSVLGVPS